MAILSKLLELGAYSMCMIRLVSIVIEGISQDDNSVVLQWIRLLVTAGMIAAFLLLGGLEDERPADHTKTEQAQYSAGMLLILIAAWRTVGEGTLWISFGLCLAYLSVFLFLKYYKMLGKNRLAESKAREELGRQRQETDYIQSVERQYQRTRELWHDLKNHIGVLQILAQEQKYQELTEYLVSFRRDVEIRMIPLRTGCAAVDALLSDKLYQAKREEIQVSLQICDLSELTLDPTDLCVVLGNLLDNCLEACARQEGPGSIEMRMRRQEGFYYLNLVNTAPEPVKESGRFLTDKQDMENGVGHGLGLRSVERIAHQYGGSMVTDYEEGKFRVVVRMQDKRE
ncbi:MAG: GHKL domain-containing protein [Candidatus Gastranaerophilales bacterium]|nr:GHKL domain-containing protein [Candidatus Gastranaerophilales bacterium]